MDSSSLFFWEQTSNRTRFNLLMMEFGESMLSEYSGVFLPYPNERRSFEDCCDLAKRGRLYICTRSLFFEPTDTRHPVIRLPYKNYVSQGSLSSLFLSIFVPYSFPLFFCFVCVLPVSPYACSVHDLRAKNLDMISGLFSIQSSVVIEMKENNVIGPFKV